MLPVDYWKRIISEDIIGSLASSAGLARELPISNVGVKNIGSTGFTHQTLMPTEAAKLCFCMHIHHSCTRTINANNAHKKECCCKLSFILLKRCRGGEERLKKLSRMMVAATCFSFYYCRTKQLVVSLFYDLVLPLSYLYQWYWRLGLRYLPFFRHSDKSGYALTRHIHHIQVGARQANGLCFSPSLAFILVGL